MARKLFARVNDGPDEIELQRSKPDAPWSFSDGTDPDLHATGPSMFSLIRNGRSHRILVLKEDLENGTIRMRIGAKTYSVKLEDERSRMMVSLGMDKAALKVREIKAPMPGMVINILVKEGDSVKKNDPLLVLEAMKMENLIKAPGDAVVRTVHAGKGKAVEKGQLLISFELSE